MFLVHINENVSLQHVAFFYLIRYGNLHRKCNKANNKAIMKKDCIFFLSFILHLNISVNFKTIQYYKTCNLLFYTFL